MNEKMKKQRRVTVAFNKKLTMQIEKHGSRGKTIEQTKARMYPDIKKKNQLKLKRDQEIATLYRLQDKKLCFEIKLNKNAYDRSSMVESERKKPADNSNIQQNKQNRTELTKRR